MSESAVRISKFLSLVLRHRPEKIGLSLGQSGWASVEQLIEASRAHGVEFTLEELQNHVHLSADVDTATKVGRRQGSPVVLRVKAGLMHRDGYVFYLSANGVWLTERVPVQYLVF